MIDQPLSFHLGLFPKIEFFRVLVFQGGCVNIFKWFEGVLKALMILNNKDVANVEVIEEWIDDIDEMIKSQIEKEKEKKR